MSDDWIRALVSKAERAGLLDMSGTKKIIDVREVDFRSKSDVSRGLDELDRRVLAMEQDSEQQPKENANLAPSTPQTIGSVAPDISHSKALLQEAVRREYQYAKLGLGLGLSAIIGGVILGLNGVAGSTSWTAKAFGLESNLNDAAPGVVLFIVGVFMIFFTRPKVKFGKMSG